MKNYYRPCSSTKTPFYRSRNIFHIHTYHTFIQQAKNYWSCPLLYMNQLKKEKKNNSFCFRVDNNRNIEVFLVLYK